jgi:predicted dehydrogenase
LRKLKVGVVGCGLSSDYHVRAYLRSPNVRLVAVYDSDLKRASEKARKYSINQVPADYQSMLRLGLDLIDIVTPTNTHSELATLALESGHNVLIEKPMATGSTECQKMIDAARKNGRALCVTHNKRFYSAIRASRSAVEKEELTPSRVSITHFYPTLYPELRPSWILTEQSGGVLWDSLVHDAYLTEYFLGETVTVHTFANKLKEAVFDSITLVLRNADKIAVCQTEWNAKEPVEILELLTREGDRFTVNLPHDLLLRKSRKYKNRSTTVLRTVYDDVHDPYLRWSAHLGRLMLGGSYEAAFPFERTFLVLIGEYVSYLTGLSPAPPVTGDEGLRSIKILEAARESIRSGKSEHVN